MKPLTGQTELLAVIADIDPLRDLAPETLRYQRLGGLTNRVFRITNNSNAWVLRLAGEGTEEYIDRHVEAHNAQVAADAGVSAEVLHVDVQTGLMLTRYLEGTETMSAKLFRQRPGAPARAGQAFRRLHDYEGEFKFQFRLFDMINDYREFLARRQAQLPTGYEDIVAEALKIKSLIDKRPIQSRSCHCDPLCENFLDDGEKMWIVDWEYSGMNDPYWDLGDLSVEGEFNEAQDREMMLSYEGRDVPDWAMARMVVYKAMCDLLWTLWGLIQHVNNNPAEDFWAYAENRFNRCKKLMQEEDFILHLRNL